MWDLPGPRTEPVSLTWQADSLPLSHQGSSHPNILNAQQFYEVRISLPDFATWLLMYRILQKQTGAMQTKILGRVNHGIFYNVKKNEKLKP